MTGEEIFNQYQEKRDYSGSDADSYAQELDTMFSNCSLNGEEKEFFALLKEAHESGKKLEFKEESELQDFYSFEDIAIQN